MGIERMAKLSYEIEDMRSLFFKRYKISISITMKVLYSNITKAIKAKPKIENLCDDLTLISIEVDEIKSLKEIR